MNLKNCIADTDDSDQIRNNLKNLVHASVIRMHDQGLEGARHESWEASAPPFPPVATCLISHKISRSLKGKFHVFSIEFHGV